MNEWQSSIDFRLLMAEKIACQSFDKRVDFTHYIGKNQHRYNIEFSNP